MAISAIRGELSRVGPGQHLAQATDAAHVLGQVVRDQDDQGVGLLQTVYHLAPGGGGSVGCFK